MWNVETSILTFLSELSDQLYTSNPQLKVPKKQQQTWDK